MGESYENWKEFRGSELGGLLSNIYGTPKPQIVYPKFSKKKFEPSEAFTSSGAKAHEITKRSINISVPKVGLERANSRPAVATVDCIGRRKQESTIKAEMDDIKMRQNYYRPAHRRTIGDEEKERLNQICTYKGGKILPDDLSYPVSETPLEIAAIKKEKDRMDKIKENRLPQEMSSSGIRRHSVLSSLEQLKEQVAGEINERRMHLESMRELGLPAADESRIKGEISRRITELQLLERK